MKCPRCNSYVKYRSMQCRKCGLRFRYSEEAESPCKRSTAAILARVGGIVGAHSFYLGYALRGVIRIVLFLGLIGLFIGPQLVNIFRTGMFYVKPDVFTIAGMVFLVANIISYILAIIESMRISSGITNTDSRGFYLRQE
ncbi:MAG: TM2 domain-containing protein [Clostridiales bacterium]|nr:TM2 domain-containing protein [Clostridiales bacterium]